MIEFGDQGCHGRDLVSTSELYLPPAVLDGMMRVMTSLYYADVWEAVSTGISKSMELIPPFGHIVNVLAGERFLSSTAQSPVLHMAGTQNIEPFY